MRLVCKGQYPSFKNPVIIPELGYKKLQAGEIVEVSEAVAKNLIKKYSVCLVEYVEVEPVAVEPVAEKPKKKKEIVNNDKTLPEESLFTKDFA